MEIVSRKFIDPWYEAARHVDVAWVAGGIVAAKSKRRSREENGEEHFEIFLPAPPQKFFFPARLKYRQLRRLC